MIQRRLIAGVSINAISALKSVTMLAAVDPDDAIELQPNVNDAGRAFVGPIVESSNCCETALSHAARTIWSTAASAWRPNLANSFENATAVASLK